MKKFKKGIISLVLIGLVMGGSVACGKNSDKTPSDAPKVTKSENPNNYIPIVQMDLESSGIQKGIIDPQYGAASKEKLGAMPLESIPLKWSGAPDETKSYAVTIVDYDTVPILGFPWIHWVACDIPSNKLELPANASTTMAKDMIQGVNSYANGYPLDLVTLKGWQVPREKAYHYGGMVPVNFPHKYTMKVYALNKTLDLKEGFGLNDLYNAMQGSIVGEGTLYGIYNAKITDLSK